MRVPFRPDLAMAVFVSLAFLALAGCSDDTTDSSPTPTPTEPSSATETATPEPAETPGAAGLTPVVDGYTLETVISADELGEASQYKTELTPIPGAPDEAALLLQTGQIYHVSLTGSFAPELWGDLSDLVEFDENEQGLLSLAFSPDFEDDGLAYIYYTPGAPEDTVVARYEVSESGLDESSAETVLTTPAGRQHVHQGGHLVFDHDGYLLLSLGDGGLGQDTLEAAQEIDNILGKVIRIDVSQEPYGIPPDNPFVGESGAREEVYALGFRNPWRMTVDSLTGEVWLGDVGEGTWEEVNRVVPGGNYGWDCYEGPDQFEWPGEPDQCSGKTFIQPRAYYGRDEGIAVVGGYVYRGEDLADLYGWYIYADYSTGVVWAVNTADAGDPVRLTDEDIFVSSFAELPDGELLIVSYLDGIFRLAPD